MNKVLFIGNFSGGSFGCPGDPFKTFPYYALSSDVEAESASRGTANLRAFNSKQAAEERLLSLSQQIADDAASSRQIRTARQMKLEKGRHIRAAIEGHTGEAVRTLRWSDQPRPTAMMCPASAKVLRAYPAGGCDAVADGRNYRVWIGSTGQSMHVVELASA